MRLLVSENGVIGKDGKLRIYNREHFLNRCGNFQETNIEVQVLERSNGFTDQMRKYYFTVVVPTMRNAFRYYGYEYSCDEIDSMLREKALYREEYNPDTDTWTKTIHRLSNNESTVSYQEFKDFLEWCIRYAALELNWSIAFPNEVLQREDLTDEQINYLVTK